MRHFAQCLVLLAVTVALAGCPLTVTIEPQGARDAGAQWQVDGGAWNNSGASVSGLSVGQHTVSFKEVSGWVKPANQVATISNTAAVTLTGTYTQIPPQTGSLTVAILPAQAVTAGAQWRLDGGAWNASGVTLTDLAAGQHTVSFKEVPGWTKPEDHTAVISAGATISLTETYTLIPPQTGSLTVAILPAEAVTAGAQWRLDGGAWNAAGITVADIAAGQHTVSFSEVAGWTKPADQTAVISTGATLSLTGTYALIPQTGSLMVSILPAAAVTAGAQWRVDGGAWTGSGITLTGLAAGQHTVSFKDVSNWTTPVAQAVTIVANATATATGTYVAQIAVGSVSVTILPAAAVTAGAQWRIDGGPFQASGATLAGVTMGQHTISFSTVSGWTTPASQSISVLANQTATATGTYVPVASVGSLTVTITPAGAVAAGAKWRVGAGDYHNSGETVTGLPSGNEQVSFSVVAGWIRPVNQDVTIASGQTTTTAGDYTAQLASQTAVVLTYNDLGMHCIGADYSELMILPPYNNLHATVIYRGEEPRIRTSGVTVRYEVQGNTTSVNKTNFWDYAQTLFNLASPLTPDLGLTGIGLAGTMASLSAQGRNDWAAEGIPIVPIDDDGSENAYPLATVTVSSNGQDIVQTQAVVPVSWEMSCNLCHFGDGITTGTAILRAHDRLHGTSLEAHKPVACGSCHAQPELGFAGIPNRKNLSRAMHGAHAPRMAMVQLDVECYACHPGFRTQCQRDIHFSKGMNCNNCHGSMTDVANPARVPWTTLPRCENCHPLYPRAGFEMEQANTLYRNSKGHHGVHCEACHGSPHAITPTVKVEDNIQAMALQGHAGTIDTCTVCHTQRPDDSFDHRFGGGDD